MFLLEILPFEAENESREISADIQFRFIVGKVGKIIYHIHLLADNVLDGDIQFYRDVIHVYDLSFLLRNNTFTKRTPGIIFPDVNHIPILKIWQA